ncbi:MAG: hypothetical protein ABJA98_33220, partial [Acidobacteriota bacterium]
CRIRYAPPITLYRVNCYGQANPNPTRAGCPSQEELSVLARRGRPIDDPAYDHLAECSPCYGHVRELQQISQRRAIDWSKKARWLAAAAALLMLVVGSAWLYVGTRGTSRQSAETMPPQVAVATLPVELDIRRFRVFRSPQEQNEPAPLVLPRGSLRLTLLLPVGSEPGAYDVQLLDGASRPVASASGQAAIRNFITELEATIDLRLVSPGSYQLALRRPGEDWHVFPATVK